MSDFDATIKKLREEFPKEQITFRPGKVTADKKKGLPLAYIDARDVMSRLDEVVGGENWQDTYEFHGTRTMCKLSIRINGEWVSKCDGAGDTNIEGEKGGLSDAFKRTAVKWGVGRYLYDLSFMYHPIDQWGKFVGDPWVSQIKNREIPKCDDETLKPAKTPKVDEAAAEELHSDILSLLEVNKGAGKAAFLNWWNAPQSKADRAMLKSLSVRAYDNITAAKDVALLVFSGEAKA